MALRDYLPFSSLGEELESKEKTLSSDDIKSISKTMRVAALALGFQGTSYFFSKRASFEPPAYDFDRILQAVDTDSYVKQAISKHKELFWKEGWEIVSENQEAVSYLLQRIDYMEMAMKRPFLDFLIEVSDQLFKFGNAFIVKGRGDIASYFPSKLTPVNAEYPIAGYYLIPTEQVRILRDKHNRPKAYQQATDPLTYAPTDRDPVWSADRVIHLHLDRKPGRAFGTPYMSNVLDDVIALRQIEEDIQNLVHRELFPLYKYKIGTAEQPAEPQEIDQAALEIENLRAEGGLILPFRHDIEIIGSENSALDASKYLDHFKERVAVGLGVAPHHLGMTMNGGNRSVTDRLDTALYDKIKQTQKIFAEMIRLNIFNELLFEGGYDPTTNPAVVGESDRCFFKFKEIDVDTQVKKENHIIQKFVNNTMTLSEVRLALGMSVDVDAEELYSGLQAKTQIDIAGAQAELSAQNAPDPKNTDGQKSAPAGQRNLPNSRKGTGNKSRPQNQNGRSSSPNIRRHDNKFLTVIESLLENEYNVLGTDIEKDDKNV